MRWRLSWTVLKDVIQTVSGLTVIGTQVPSAHPSAILLGVALVLTGTPLAQATHKVITGPVTGPGLPSGEPPGLSSSVPSSGLPHEGTSEPAAERTAP